MTTYMPTVHLESDDPEVLQKRIEMLCEALARVLVHAGMLRVDHGPMTGPEILTAAYTFCESPRQNPEEFLPGVLSEMG